MKRANFILLIIILMFIFCGDVDADNFNLDDAPYWFWADSWQGDLNVFYRNEFEGKHITSVGYAAYNYVDDGEIIGSAVNFDEGKVKFTFKTWRGTDNTARVNWREEGVGAAFHHDEDVSGKADNIVFGSGQKDTVIDTKSEIVIDIEEKAFRITFLLPVDFAMEIKREGHGEWEIVAGVFEHSFESDPEEELFYPSMMGEVVKELPEAGEGLVGVEDMNDGYFDRYDFDYNLIPEYNKNQWRDEYMDYLTIRRARYIKMWEDIQSKCETGEMSGIICRTATSVLIEMDRWLNYLADDGERVANALLNKEAPGLLERIRREFRGRTDRYVMKGAASTCGLVHEYLFSFYDRGATGSIYAIHRRLPAELKQLYSLERLEALHSAFQKY